MAMVCKYCGHLKGVHSIGGCTHTHKDGRLCMCNITRSPKDLKNYEEGKVTND